MRDHEYDIFISYRRNGGEMYASFIYEKLRYLGYNVFQDQQSLGGGFFDENLFATLAHCSDMILILTENSLLRCVADENDWVRQEISFALSHKINIVPVQVGRFTWPPNLPNDIADISRCNGIETTDHYLGQDIELRLVKYLNALPENSNRIPHVLASHIERPKQLFIGRQDEIECIHRMLSTETNVVFIQGMGGVGKSEVARAYAKIHFSEYETIVFAHYERSLLQTFIDDEVFNISGVKRLISDTIKMESRENYFNRKLSALKKYSAEKKTLIIIDNFDVSEEALTEEFYKFVDGEYKIIFTSRTDFSEYFATVLIPGVNNMEFARDLFFAYSGRTMVEHMLPEVDALLEHIQYHTLTIELMAKHMKRANVKPHEMLAAFKSQGAKALNSKVKLPRGHAEDESAFSHIQAIFNTEQLTICEKNALTYMALMPASGVCFDNFLRWTHIQESYILHDLATGSWLSIDFDTDTIKMHAIVREVILSKLLPNDEVQQTLIATSRTLWASAERHIADGIWTEAVKKLLIIYPWITELEKESSFRVQICAAIAKCYDNMTCFSEAYEYYHEICQPYVQNPQKIPEELFPVLRRYTHCMVNGKNIVNEAYTLRKLLLQYATETMDSVDDVLPFYEDVANSAADLCLYDESYELRKYIYEQYCSSTTAPIGKIIYSKSSYANSVAYLGRLEEAYDLRKSICEDVKEHFGETHAAFYVACSNLACCCLHMGRYAEALALLKASFTGIAKERGRKDFYTLCICTNLGAALCCIRDRDCARFNEDIYAQQAEIWGNNYDVTLKTLANLASAYFISGDYQKAYELEEQLIFAAESIEEFIDTVRQKFVKNHLLTEKVVEGGEPPEHMQREWFTVILQLPAII